MKIDRAVIEHLAKLSRLKLTEDEIPLYEHQLGDIVALMEELAKIDVSSVPETAQVLGVSNVFRADEPGAPFSRDKLLASAPESQDDCFTVPRVIG